MVSSDARITGAVARQTGLRAVQIETNDGLVLGFVSSDCNFRKNLRFQNMHV